MKTEFIHVRVQLDGVIDRDTEFLDFGAVNLSCEGRELCYRCSFSLIGTLKTDKNILSLNSLRIEKSLMTAIIN